nr:hypothetical protein [Tanacetum cinerariifolium]
MVVSFSGAKKRHEKIERLTTPVVVLFSLASYITASAVENGTRNRTTHHSSGGAILAPLDFFSFCNLNIVAVSIGHISTIQPATHYKIGEKSSFLLQKKQMPLLNQVENKQVQSDLE